MHVVLRPSPSRFHRYRVTLPNGHDVDFGSTVCAAYVDHKDAMRMRFELHTRAAVIPIDTREETDPPEIHRKMLYVDLSLREDWSDEWSGDYWDRWLLQSYPTVEQAKLYMTMRKGILFMPLDDTCF